MTKSTILLFLVLMYTVELIKELISCPKTVVEAPRDMKEGGSGFEKKLLLLSLLMVNMILVASLRKT